MIYQPLLTRIIYHNCPDVPKLRRDTHSLLAQLESGTSDISVSDLIPIIFYR